MAENRFASDDAPAPEAAADEPASPFTTLTQGEPSPLAEILAEAYPPGARRPRRDGFTPEAIGHFLDALAAHGIVEHAARAAGVSAQAAYAFRNRRSGRAFARMWDAVLIHRARARLAAENQHVATLGCVSRRYRDGELVGEYHYRDNRLAMAMLTRLDRLAEREAPNDDHLRALAEDLDEFIACAAEGGDLDSFVEARRPEPAAAREAPPASMPEAEQPARYKVWQPDDGDLATDVPPPPGFHGWQSCDPEDPWYLRDLTPGEKAIWLARNEDPDFAVEVTTPEDMYDGIWELVGGGFGPEAAETAGKPRSKGGRR